MKKLVSFIAGAVVLSSAAVAAPSMVKSNANDGGYVVTYDYRDKPTNGWYAAIRAELAFWNFKKTLSDNDPGHSSDTENYSLKPVFGGNLSVGKWFNSNWRGDIELGYLGHYTQEENASKFGVQLPYAMLNGYYNFINGLYVGLGVGAAMPIVTTEHYVISLEGDANKIGFGVIGGVMFGYSTQVDDNFSVDIRYRLAGATGTTGERRLEDYVLENKVDFILSNSISLGLRYNF